jgi:hypothetical protein
VSPAQASRTGAELAKRSRKAQGLPPTIREPEIVRQVVALLVNGRCSP